MVVYRYVIVTTTYKMTSIEVYTDTTDIFIAKCVTEIWFVIFINFLISRLLKLLFILLKNNKEQCMKLVYHLIRQTHCKLQVKK